MIRHPHAHLAPAPSRTSGCGPIPSRLSQVSGAIVGPSKGGPFLRHDMSKEPELTKPTGLALLREPFAPNQISKLPKPSKAQTEQVRSDFKIGIRCKDCGAWHHPAVVHLDYVGHAALTDRLLDADPNWTWEPVATDDHGLPMTDADGGMWIRLTVCGMTRLGYGDAQGKAGPDATKERIGDALRNAAMRFGAALDLWHKGVLHEAEAVPKQLASDEQLAALQEYADAGVMTDGQKIWLEKARDKITADEASYALEKLKEKESK